VEEQDVTAIITGLFDLNAKLAEITRDVSAIRNWLVEDDEEEEG